MYLIYGKGKVGNAVAGLCMYLQIPYEIRDDSDTPSDYTKYEVIIPSPGIPSHHPIFQTGKILSELDFAHQFLPEKFQTIAITGTDGKSTTTWILYSILNKEYFGKKSVYISGNFDIPYSETVLEILKKGEKKGIIVLEISSFMSYMLGKSKIRTKLGRIFKPEYSIFTNLKPDHLNWHGDLQNYFDAKMNLMVHTAKKCIINQEVIDFVGENKLHLTLPENIRFYSVKKVDQKDISSRKDSTDGENIIVSGRKKYRLSETRFSGLHNALNILSAGLVLSELKICSKRIKNYLSDISGLPHRLELICDKHGRHFIDDSKSTSNQSLIAALSAFDHSKTILIAGGSDKGDTFDALENALDDIKYAILIGATREKIAEKCSKAKVPYIFADDMEKAVIAAYRESKAGDTILLSPGCASFGLFRDYLDRAEKFRSAIEKLSD